MATSPTRRRRVHLLTAVLTVASLVASACSSDRAATPTTTTTSSTSTTVTTVPEASAPVETIVWQESVVVDSGGSQTEIASGVVETTGDSLANFLGTTSDGRPIAALSSPGQVAAGFGGTSPGVDFRADESAAGGPAIVPPSDPIQTQRTDGATYDVTSQVLGAAAVQTGSSLVVAEAWADPDSGDVARYVLRTVASTGTATATITATLTRTAEPARLAAAPPFPAPVPQLASSITDAVAGCAVAAADETWRLTCPDRDPLEVAAIADPIGGSPSKPHGIRRGIAAVPTENAACDAANTVFGWFDTYSDYEPLIEPGMALAIGGIASSGYGSALIAPIIAAGPIIEGLVAATILVLAVTTAACLASSLMGGDAHLVTFDGQRYDFQASGEFVAFTSDALTVQTRFEHAEEPSISYATGVAAKVGGHVVSVLADAMSDSDGRIPVTIDGEDVLLDRSGVTFDDGGIVAVEATTASSVVVVAPDHSFLRVRLLPHTLGVEAGAVQGTGSGLLRGFTLRTGETLSPAEAATPEGLYGRFGESWRVTEDERLFTDGTWADHHRPEDLEAPVPRALDDFDAVARTDAIAACVAAGVPAGPAAESCAFDVLATGDPGWIDDAALTATGGGAGRVFAVPATADIYAAGHAADAATAHGGTTPVLVDLGTLASGDRIHFTSVTGRTDCCGGRPSFGADGDTRVSDVQPTDGLAGYRDDRALALVGVFLSGREPQDPPPETLDFTGRHDELTSTPGLDQPFFIGDGRTADGVVQGFVVPDGATRLLVGFADAPNFSGSPGTYDDDSGSLRVAVTRSAAG